MNYQFKKISFFVKTALFERKYASTSRKLEVDGKSLNLWGQTSLLGTCTRYADIRLIERQKRYRGLRTLMGRTPLAGAYTACGDLHTLYGLTLLLEA